MFLNLIGLIFNFIGALFLSVSVVNNHGQAHQIVNGKKIYIASILSNRFRIGIIILIFGFLFQLISLIQINISKISSPYSINDDDFLIEVNSFIITSK